MNTALRDSGCGQIEKAWRVGWLGRHILSGYKWMSQEVLGCGPGLRFLHQTAGQEVLQLRRYLNRDKEKHETLE